MDTDLYIIITVLKCVLRENNIVYNVQITPIKKDGNYKFKNHKDFFDLSVVRHCMSHVCYPLPKITLSYGYNSSKSLNPNLTCNRS